MNFSPEAKMRSSDRILELAPMEGMDPKRANGIIDPSLFKEGGNRLHAVMDPETCLWSFKYEKGALPPALKGTYTGFRALKKHAENYFFHRNVRITEVKD